MRRAALILVIAGCAVPAAAQQQVTATLNVSLPPVVRLSFSTNTIVFADAHPDMMPMVPGSPPVTIIAKVRAALGSRVTLTIEASDDLRSGLETIPVSAITWTAAGAGFVNGTLNRTTPQIVGTWGAPGVYTGEQSFLFTNRWTYAVGTYTVTLLYTLATP